jgi:hypothetical protein
MLNGVEKSQGILAALTPARGFPAVLSSSEGRPVSSNEVLGPANGRASRFPSTAAVAPYRPCRPALWG